MVLLFILANGVFVIQTEFRDYPALLRQAISVARRLQDPLLEFSRLCNQDDDLLCLKLHPQQVRDSYQTWYTHSP